MEGQIVIVHAVEFDAYPSAHANVRWQEEPLRLSSEQHWLHSLWYRYPDGNVPIIVMIVGEHDVNLLSHKESRLAVGKFFRRLWKSETDSPHPPELFLASFRFRSFDLQSPTASRLVYSILNALFHCSDSRETILNSQGL